MQLSIIIPAYNEEERLPLTLQRIFEYLTVHYGGKYELIVVDDGSTDATVEKVKLFQQHYPQLRILRLSKNQGRGAAVKEAVFKANGDFILETDADGSVNEHAIVDFLNYFTKNPNVDVITGSRTVEGSRILTPQPNLRKVFGYSFFFLTKLFFGWPVTDRINGFKMYRREAALDIFKNQFEKRFVTKAEVIYVAEVRGWEVRELPILWTEYKGSKVRPIHDSIDSLLGLFRIIGRRRKGIYEIDLVREKKVETVIEAQKNYKSVLITGGCGFMGSNFVRLFYNKHPGSHIVNLDLLTYAGNPDNLKDINEQEAGNKDKRYKFIQGDICNEKLLEKIFSEYKFDLVVHFAAESHVDRSIFGSAEFIRTNIEGTGALVEAARRHEVKRFVHISTDEIYGSYLKGYATEDWAMNPSNPYAASKAGADHLVQSYIKTHGFPAVIVRGSNNYGPYQYPEKLIPLAITNLIGGEKIPIHGYGAQIRSWVHVDDFCNAVELVALGNPTYTTYNISGEEKSVLEVLQIIAAFLNKELHQNRFHVDDRPGADIRYAVDASRLINDLGWCHKHGVFEESVGNVVEWYVNNPEWWQSVKMKKGFTDHYERQAKAQWT